MQLVLMYFDTVIGPEIFFSYPDSVLERVSKKMEGFFDLDIKDNFFEVSLIEENIKITNLYFEIPSSWARGKVEMLMLSTISGKDYRSELSYKVLKNYSFKIMSLVNIYKAFYTGLFINKNDHEIDLKKEELETLLIECYNHLEEKLKSEIGDEKIIKKFKKFKW
ncbi:hypothetical protein LCGC14_1660260 [marine sediment metagenome]|uniref:Uncharacterized protein n=1 Tax=marine sediment metagenome TaxID=412755 RepID=A0A0F9HUZ7_9ZZZZ